MRSGDTMANACLFGRLEVRKKSERDYVQSGMGESLTSQWQELQRQAVIYCDIVGHGSRGQDDQNRLVGSCAVPDVADRATRLVTM